MRRKDFDRDKFITETWPEALESGQFEQITGTLHDHGLDDLVSQGVRV